MPGCDDYHLYTFSAEKVAVVNGRPRGRAERDGYAEPRQLRRHHQYLPRFSATPLAGRGGDGRQGRRVQWWMQCWWRNMRAVVPNGQ